MFTMEKNNQALHRDQILVLISLTKFYIYKLN